MSFTIRLKYLAKIRRYIAKIWEGQKYFLRQGSFYSEEVIVKRGCTQGDIDSPIIFNVIVDAVLRQWTKLKNDIYTKHQLFLC